MSKRWSVVAAPLLAVVLLLSSCGQEKGGVPDAGAQSRADKLVTSQTDGDAQSAAGNTDAGQGGNAEVSDGDSEIPPEIDEAAGFDHWDVPNLENDPITGPDGPGLIFHDLRVGEHEGFYRVVVEFTGEGEPGWVATSPEVPIEAGRGEPLDVEGNFFLDLALTGTAIPMDEEDYEAYYAGPKKLTVGPLEVIEDGTFEGATHVVVGLDKMRDIRFERLEDPARFVVDIRR